MRSLCVFRASNAYSYMYQSCCNQNTSFRDLLLVIVNSAVGLSVCVFNAYMLCFVQFQLSNTSSTLTHNTDTWMQRYSSRRRNRATGI